MSARHSEFLVDLGGADAVARVGLGSDYLGGPTDLSGVLTLSDKANAPTFKLLPVWLQGSKLMGA
jgi:microsomal dipeptidase-like Zn-dependent dipeptidase